MLRHVTQERAKKVTRKEVVEVTCPCVSISIQHSGQVIRVPNLNFWDAVKPGSDYNIDSVSCANASYTGERYVRHKDELVAWNLVFFDELC